MERDGVARRPGARKGLSRLNANVPCHDVPQTLRQCSIRGRLRLLQPGVHGSTRVPHKDLRGFSVPCRPEHHGLFPPAVLLHCDPLCGDKYQRPRLAARAGSIRCPRSAESLAPPRRRSTAPPHLRGDCRSSPRRLCWGSRGRKWTSRLGSAPQRGTRPRRQLPRGHGRGGKRRDLKLLDL